MINDVKVSILCMAYNHEKYIAKALDGFIMQKTDFPFEVIIHDDASTDDTAGIIRQYEEKWPDIIKPIYQKKNQYQQGIDILKRILFPAAKGTYIAICEGDDYWTDSTKLQQQYDYMQAHPNCTLAAHKTVRIFEDGSFMGNFSGYDFSAPGACYMSADQVITHVNDFHTSSLFIRRESYEKNRSFFDEMSTFDYAMKILFATDSPEDVYIIPQNMSAYRVSATGSWSQRIRDDNNKYKKHIEDSIRFLRKIDEYRGYKYRRAIETEILNREFKIEVLNHNKAAWKMEKYQAIIQKMSKKQRLVNHLSLCMPKQFSFVHGVYQRIKKYVER